jgi:hypothetical protein
MPRSSQSPISKIVAFFQGSSLEVMELAFGLVRDTVKARREGSQGKSKKKITRKRKAKPAAPPSADHTANQVLNDMPAAALRPRRKRAPAPVDAVNIATDQPAIE